MSTSTPDALDEPILVQTPRCRAAALITIACAAASLALTSCGRAPSVASTAPVTTSSSSAATVSDFVDHNAGLVVPASVHVAAGADLAQARAAVHTAQVLYTFWNTKERVVSPPPAAGSLGKDLGDLKSNGPWLVLFFVAFLNLTNVGMRNGAGIYYFKYVVGQEAALGNFNKIGFLCFILGALATKLFTARFSRRALMIWLTLINGAAIAGCYWADPHNLPLLYALNIIAIFQEYRWRQYVNAHAADPTAWHGLEDNDTWQDGHLQADAAELKFWLGDAPATPA